MNRPDAHASWPTAATRLVALLGWPVRHSLSPVMHNAAFADQDLDMACLALATPPDHVREVVAALGAVGAVGANVTVPHKVAVMASCDALTDEARLVGAVNTLSWGADGLVGDTTDAVGLRAALTADVSMEPGERCLLVGTGGAARAAAVAAGRLGSAVTVVGRRPGAAAEIARLAERAGAPIADHGDLADDAALRRAVRAASLVLNATSVGMAGESLPAPCHDLSADQVAYDLVYAPVRTPFLADAGRAGAETHNGLGMLVGQAAASYRA